MSVTTGLRREIKRTFVPYMAQRGYVFDTCEAPFAFGFRKTAPDAIYVCDIQWEKSGKRRFVVNFGKCDPKGVTALGNTSRLPIYGHVILVKMAGYNQVFGLQPGPGFAKTDRCSSV